VRVGAGLGHGHNGPCTVLLLAPARGISGGFAAVFGTPLAGALFGIEVLYLGRLEYQVLFPCLVAGMVGHLACGEVHPVSPATVGTADLSHGGLVALGLGGGLLFGLIAVVLMELQHLVHHLAQRLRNWPLLLGAVGGVFVAALLSVAGSQYGGLGIETIDRALMAEHIFALAFLIKILATLVTLETGGSGGIITPMFFIGATAGNVTGRLLGVSPSLMAALGMVAILSAGANTPIAASVMALETLGVAFGTYAALACGAAFLIAGHRSLYPSQVLGLAKTPSLDLPEDTELGKVEVVRIRLRPHTLLSFFVHLFRRKGAEDASSRQVEDKE
ncbi:MAG: chloride channel protein, partial [Armatimonadota bacterium]